MIQNAGTSSIKRCTRSDNLHPLLHPAGCIVPCITVHQISQKTNTRHDVSGVCFFTEVHDDEPLLFPLCGKRIVCAAQNKRFRQMLCANGVQNLPALAKKKAIRVSGWLFSTKSVLADGINPPSVDEIASR